METDVGGAVTATDPDNDSTELTYTISGTDAAYFSIVQNSGQIKTRAVLDREEKNRFRVTVTVEDPSLSKATTSLTIEATDVNEIPEITSGDITIYYAESDTATVSTYRATDPEGRPIVWTLSGNDADDFTITGGLLKFNTPPDYESAGDANTHNEYEVTVGAGDGGEDRVATEQVTVKVRNVDEEGRVELSAERPKVGVELTAMLTDPDSVAADGSDITGRTWQWARSSSRTGTYTDIEEADNTDGTYTPVEDDIGKYLRAMATYRDPEGAGKSAHGISRTATEREDYTNTAPVFLNEDGDELATTDTNDDGNLDTTDPIDRSIDENAASRAPVGAPVSARDIGRNGRQETLTYVLGGADEGSFDIVRSTGQIRVKSGIGLNFEGTAGESNNCASLNACVVTVTASDSSGKSNVITVNIAITGVDETPTFTGGLNAVSLDEGGFGPVQVGDAYIVDDPEGRAITWDLSGTDSDDFSISASGVVSFQSPPDYENPTDSDRRNTYDVTVEATDGGGNTVSRSVRVTVNNINEDGTVTLSHTVPEVGAALTASLSDPDTARNVTWQWYRGTPPDENRYCDSDSDPNCRIRNNANRASYTPVEEDATHYLTAKASYRDGENSEQSAETRTPNTVADQDTDNERPRFFKDANSANEAITRDTREVQEDAGPSQSVGDPVRATDRDTPQDSEDTLSYSLSGTDVASFDIDSTNGQILTKAALDYETKKIYRVTVKALDPSGASATITVEIKVLDVDEPPELSKRGLVTVGRGSITHEENQGGEVARYTATGPNAVNVSWRLSGTDASDFSISRSGVLSFRSTPNFERPVDANQDNTYELTVIARSGTIEDNLEVTVIVLNVDEEGETTLSPTRGSVGGRLTATVTDLDGPVTAVSWDWARSADGTTGWITILGANSNSYIPTEKRRGILHPGHSNLHGP